MLAPCLASSALLEPATGSALSRCETAVVSCAGPRHISIGRYKVHTGQKFPSYREKSELRDNRPGASHQMVASQRRYRWAKTAAASPRRAINGHRQLAGPEKCPAADLAKAPTDCSSFEVRKPEKLFGMFLHSATCCAGSERCQAAPDCFSRNAWLR